MDNEFVTAKNTKKLESYKSQVQTKIAEGNLSLLRPYQIVIQNGIKKQ